MWFLWSNPYKVEVVITSLIEMLELPNFGHMITTAIKLDSPDKILLVTSSTEVMTSQISFKNTFILRKSRVANFADTIKIETIFIKNNQKKFKKLEIMYKNAISIRIS